MAVRSQLWAGADGKATGLDKRQHARCVITLDDAIDWTASGVTPQEYIQAPDMTRLVYRGTPTIVELRPLDPIEELLVTDLMGRARVANRDADDGHEFRPLWSLMVLAHMRLAIVAVENWLDPDGNPLELETEELPGVGRMLTDGCARSFGAEVLADLFAQSKALHGLPDIRDLKKKSESASTQPRADTSSASPATSATSTATPSGKPTAASPGTGPSSTSSRPAGIGTETPKTPSGNAPGDTAAAI